MTRRTPSSPHTLLEMLTPIAHEHGRRSGAWRATTSSSRCSGYGYTTEFDVEQYYRDNRKRPDSGHQWDSGSGPARPPVVMNGGEGLAVLAETIGATVASAEATGGDAAGYAAELANAVQRLTETTATLWKGSLIGSPRWLIRPRILGLRRPRGGRGCGWIKCWQVGERTGDFDGKRATALLPLPELPKTGPQFDLLTSLDRTTLDTDPAWL